MGYLEPYRVQQRQKQNAVLGGNNPTLLDTLAALPKKVLGLLVDKSSINTVPLQKLHEQECRQHGKGPFSAMVRPHLQFWAVLAPSANPESSRGHQNDQGWRTGRTRRD